MANEKNLMPPAQKGEVRNPNGKKPGTKNRTTLVRQILEMTGVVPETILSDLQARYPAMKGKLSLEFIMTVQQVDKAIMQQDTAAYKAVMDSAYGSPKQVTDVEIQHKNLPAWLQKKPTY